MSRRVNVTLSNEAYGDLQAIARRRGISLQESVRQALVAGLALETESGSDTRKKLKAIRKAVRHNFPTCDIGLMLKESSG